MDSHAEVFYRATCLAAVVFLFGLWVGVLIGR